MSMRRRKKTLAIDVTWWGGRRCFQYRKPNWRHSK